MSCEGTTFIREDGEEDTDGLEGMKNSVVYIHVRLQRCAWSVEKLLSREIFLGFECTKITVVVLFWPQKKLTDKLKKFDVGEGGKGYHCRNK